MLAYDRQHYAPTTLFAKYKVPQPNALRLSHFAIVWLNLFPPAFPALFLSVKYYICLWWIRLSISIIYLITHTYIIPYKKKQVLESGNLNNLAAYIHWARNVWESWDAQVPFLAKTGSCFHADILTCGNRTQDSKWLFSHYISSTLRYIT